MGPYMDQDIIIKKTKPRNMSIVTKETQSTVSFDSAVTPKAPRLRAATMMMETKTIKKKVIKPKKIKQQMTFCEEQNFHCDECNEDFTTGQALGGHMSRVHPGKSETYARKVERRKEREFDRELLRLAKIKHFVFWPIATQAM